MKRHDIVLLFICILISLPFVIRSFHTEHKISYKINQWTIEESFHLEDNHVYDFVIKNDNLEYIITIHQNLNKKKRVIQKIKKYKEDNITCIIPIYKKDSEKRIYCIQEQQQVSNEYLKNNNAFKKIINKLKVTNISTKETKPTSYENIKVYQKNIINNDTFIIWNYKGMYLLNKDRIKNQKILDYDLYDNIMTTQTKRYFVLFENTNVKGIENIYYYDRKKEILKTYHPDTILSKDSYINGVVKEIIFVTDNKKQIQYKINIKKEIIQEIGNENIGYIYYDQGKETIKNHRDFFKEKQIFNQEDNYQLIENRMFYKNRILLFEMNNIKDWKVIGDNILVLKDDTVYCYNEKNGLHKIVESNELRYNYENIYTLWKE